MIHLKYSDKYIIINKISKHFSQLEAIIARNPGLMAKQGAEVILDASGSKNATEYITTQSEKIAFSAAEY